MNSPLPPASIVARIIFTLLIATSVLVLLNKAKSGSISAPQEQPSSKAKPIERKPTRRLFENRVPEHLPIKVKIKREKERKFRDLENDDWPRDLELEVKNVGEKPIYFLFFYLEIPEAKVNGRHQVFSIVYGRVELADLNNRPQADDVPISPGETKILKIEDMSIRGWPDQRARGLLPPRIHGVRLIIQDLTFGDGTGFEGTTGAPRSKRDEEPTKGACLPPSDRYGGTGVTPLIVDGVGNLEDIRKSRSAGMFQPASFLSSGQSTLTAASLIADSQPECNCANDSCQHGNPRDIDSNATNEHCYQCGTFKDFARSFCFDPGNCYFVDWINRWCASAGGFYCVVAIVNPAPQPQHRHQIVPETRRTPVASAPMRVAFTSGIVRTADRAHFMPTTIFIHKPGVPHMRQNRAIVIAAPVIRQITIAQTQSTVIGMIISAIAMTTTRQVGPAVAVTPITQPVRLMNVVQGDAIRLVKYVCLSRRRRRHHNPKVANAFTSSGRIVLCPAWVRLTSVGIQTTVAARRCQELRMMAATAFGRARS